MSRSRMIKPGFWSSKTVCSCSRDIRLLFAGLWNFADDFGFLLATPRKILGDVFPFDDDFTEEVCKKSLEKLQELGLIVIGVVNDKPILKITNWEEHQKVDHPSELHVWLDFESYETFLETLARDSRNTREAVATVSEKIRALIRIRNRNRKRIRNRSCKDSVRQEVFSTEGKTQYSKNVWMTREEYSGFLEKLGSVFLKRCIEKLDGMIENSEVGRAYLSHAAALRSWVIKAVEKEGMVKNPTPQPPKMAVVRKEDLADPEEVSRLVRQATQNLRSIPVGRS